jgi:hypothetical protein
MLGYRVIPITKESSSGTLASWIAPDLDCFPLMETYTSTRGPRNERVVTRVDLGEPPESLFAIPDEYTERSPFELDAVWAAQYAGRTFWGADVQRMGDRYFKGRTK